MYSKSFKEAFSALGDPLWAICHTLSKPTTSSLLQPFLASFWGPVSLLGAMLSSCKGNRRQGLTHRDMYHRRRNLSSRPSSHVPEVVEAT
ncbi:hypothetical protein P7K49_018625, partial [Saguinus oedipus]